MATTPSLNPGEESAWRALTYVANHLVKTLGEDLASETTVALSEYVVLAHLSEAENQQLRIGDLASISALSPSRMSRLVDEMAAKGHVTKVRVADDGRCALATLTPMGLSTLKETYPTQLRNVRRRVFDLLTSEEVQALDTALWKIRDGLESMTRAAGRGLDQHSSSTEAQSDSK
ncbi:MAG TPA: MarR family transcriptional regulator [Acidimicrobiales bacterium]|nr:MarR family transcriptional regulator [Acidimicrobiales bacterium]